MKKIYDVISKNLKAQRKSKELTQEELAELAEISKNTIYNLESENRRYGCSVECLDRIAHALGIPTYRLLITSQKEIGEYEDYDEHEKEENAKRKDIFYPEEHTYNTITTLLEFIALLPLVDADALLELISRIAGKTINYENYITSQLDYIYNNIPDSNAKRYAEYEIQRIKCKRRGEDADSDLYNLTKEQIDTKRKEINKCYMSYINRIEQLKKENEAIKKIKTVYNTNQE